MTGNSSQSAFFSRWTRAGALRSDLLLLTLLLRR
jgi:hypothetical protein